MKIYKRILHFAVLAKGGAYFRRLFRADSFHFGKFFGACFHHVEGALAETLHDIPCGNFADALKNSAFQKLFDCRRAVGLDNFHAFRKKLQAVSCVVLIVAGKFQPHTFVNFRKNADSGDVITAAS